MPQTVSQLEQTLRARRFVMTTELTPPVSFDPDDLLLDDAAGTHVQVPDLRGPLVTGTETDRASRRAER